MQDVLENAGTTTSVPLAQAYVGDIQGLLESFRFVLASDVDRRYISTYLGTPDNTSLHGTGRD